MMRDNLEVIASKLDYIVSGLEGVMRLVLLVMALFCAGVLLKCVVEYTVNSTRSTDHWVKYYDVRPVRQFFSIGEYPVFISHSEWHHDVVALWPDVMHCTAVAGKGKGMTTEYRLEFKTKGEPKKAGKSGFYDEKGNVVAGSSDGRWAWSGRLPSYASDCTLQPVPVLYPSPLVVRTVDIPRSKVFRFR